MLPATVQRTFVLGELANMLSRVELTEVTEISGPSASTAERLRALVALAKRNRTPGVDPGDDIVDPYGRSNAVYADSFRQIRDALEPIIRLAAPSAPAT
jgi:protein-tyrosine phosphatase